MTPILPSRTALKAQAKALRTSRAAAGHPLTHSAALEAIAQNHGYRDWNTLSAAAPQDGTPKSSRFTLGAPVTGTYLGHPFSGKLVGARERAGGTYVYVTVKFDAPIDVVQSASFSAFRQRVSATVDADGVSPQHLSDGTPHMVLRAA